jgi:predicted O-linked N-acetylglucosamine transferase (SPINDLY family)
MGRLINAEECYREALRLMPNHYKAYIGLGSVLQELGLTNEAEESFREAIRLDSNHETYSNLLFHLNYSIYHNGEEIYKEYKQYSDFISGLKLKKFIHNKNKLIQKARIRIGYCSADFKGHACRFFIEPFFSFHDKDKFELYAYANVIQPDLHTERFKTYFDYWVDVLNLNDLQMAQRIYDDNIDILIDLSGYTKGNRLPVFALKPAPIQVTYFSGTGYTSGLKEIDYFFGDNTITPFGSEQYFSERIWLLPSPITCYDYTLNNAPEVSDLPALYNGYITFGSMSRNIRLNDEVLAAWKEIMIHIPDCRLQLNQKIYSDSLTKEFILKRMKCLGMPIDRIDLLDSVPHWNGFHGIDIVLDTFPHNGGTATIEAIFMGVPVLTKLDRPSVGRLGASILSSIELHDWIVEDTSTYINKAIQFSRDLVLLKELRKTLRSRILDSELTNTKSLIKKIENAYQEMIDRVK